MIELIASGPVRLVEDTDIRRRDGDDSIHGRVKVTRQVEVDIDLEFPQGHVNLEGFSPSGGDLPVREMVIPYVRGAMPDHGADIEHVSDDEWSVELWGEWWDWVQAAHRYQVERPRYSIVGILKFFRSWEETDSDTIELAISKVEQMTALASKPMKDLDDEAYDHLTGCLRFLDERLQGTIKNSYKPEG